MIDTYRKCFGIFIFIASTAFTYHLLSLRKKKTLKISPKNEIIEVLMFSEPSQKVESKFSKSYVSSSTDRLLYYLNQSRHTLDICMYMITHADIAHLIQKLHNRGVKIRIIVDADMAYATGSATKRIERQGIELRWMKSTNLMHHKFCLIDASAEVKDADIIPFAMTGSLNWTRQALSGNWENVLVTSNTEIVNGLKEEFEKLWVKFKPIVSQTNYYLLFIHNIPIYNDSK